MESSITQLAERLGTNKTEIRRCLKYVGYEFSHDRKKVLLSNDWQNAVTAYYQNKKQERKATKTDEIERLQARVSELENDKLVLQRYLEQQNGLMALLQEQNNRLLLEAPKRRGFFGLFRNN